MKPAFVLMAVANPTKGPDENGDRKDEDE